MKGKFPTNYYLTFSRSEDNEAECLSVLASLRAKGSAKHDRTGFVVREVTP
jgi:hypothetical protein